MARGRRRKCKCCGAACNFDPRIASVGTPLQEDLVRTTDRLLRLGQDILAMSQGPPSPLP